MYTAVLHFLYSSFRWLSWVKVGCWNGYRYKKVENRWWILIILIVVVLKITVVNVFSTLRDRQASSFLCGESKSWC